MRKWSRRLLVAGAAYGLGGAGLVAGASAPAGADATWSMSQSGNWSGYNVGVLDRGTPLTSVSAQWTVPTATAHKANDSENSSMWIGIGGGCVDTGCTAADSTLIQVGTEQDVDSSGKATYSAWWEIIPAPSVTAPMTVNPGDHIVASISQGTVPETWNVSIRDTTNGQSAGALTNPMPYTSDYSTAEYIVETPVVASSSGAGLGTMPNLSSPVFDLSTINGAPAAFTPAEAVQLVDQSNNQVVATPSAPDSDTDGFAVCTWATSCSTPGS